MKNPMEITFSKIKRYVNKNKVKILILLFVSMNIWFLLPKNTDLFTSNSRNYSNLNLSSIPHNSLALNDVSLSLENISTFFNTYVPDQLERRQIAGMTVSVVQKKEVLFSKGYGFANIEDNETVKANETMFRIGSISKTFVATAVMQLVEQEILDLDENINTYLTTFQIPDTYPEPITMRHLLTHTAGWEKVSQAILTFRQPRDFETMIEEMLPKRVRPPGIIPSYSNYGMSLAGYIVQEVSHQPFEQYIRDEIFLPLGMNFSTARQPVNSNLSNYMSEGYNRNLDAIYFEYIVLPPCGALSSTASDMANFMISQLNNGTLGDTQILNNETIQDMHSPHYIISPNFPAIQYGFYEQINNNEYSFGHGGDTQVFHSMMTLFPEKQIGFFVSYNTNNDFAIREILQAFVDNCFPQSNLEHIDPLKGTKSRARRCTGMYLQNRRIYIPNERYSSVDIYSSMDEQIEVYLNKDGTLNIFGMNFLEIEPYIFYKKLDGYSYTIAFQENERGEIQYFYLDSGTPTVAYEKLNLGYSSDLGWRILCVSIIMIYAFSLIIWAIMLGYRKWKKKPHKSSLSLLGRVLILLNLIGIVIIIDSLTKLLAENIILAEYIGKNFPNLIVIPVLLSISIIITIVISILSWINIKKKFFKPSWLLWEKIHYSVASISGIGLIWVMTLLNFF